MSFFTGSRGDQPEIVRVLDGRQDIDDIFSDEANG